MNIKDMLSSTSSGGEFGLPHTVIYEDSLDVQGKVLYDKVVSLLKTPYLDDSTEILIIYPFFIKNTPFGCVIPAYEEGGKVRESFDEFLFENNDGLRDAAFALLDYINELDSDVLSDSARDYVQIPSGYGVDYTLATVAQQFADKDLSGAELESKVKERLAETGKFTDKSVESATKKVLSIISKARKAALL